MARAVRWVMAGVLAAGLLGGCDSSAEDPVGTPTPSPSVSSSSASPSASPSPSPTATGPEVPAAAREKTDAGAEAFVRYFYTRINEAWTKPDSTALVDLSASTCQFCMKMTDRARALEKAKQRYASDPVTVGDLRKVPNAPEGSVFFDMELTQNQVDIVDVNGAVVDADDRKQGYFDVGVRWQEARWVFLDMENKK